MQVIVKYLNGGTETFDNAVSYATQDNGELDIFSDQDGTTAIATIARETWLVVIKKKEAGDTDAPGTDDEDRKNEDDEEDEELDFEFDPLKRKARLPE